MAKKHIIEAVSTLIGFTIGAGILGIPFVVAKAGFLTGMASILVLGMLVLTLNLYLGEITLRTKGIHQLTGYARIYLGKVGHCLMMASFIISMHGALIAYIIKTGEFLHALLNPLFGGTHLIYSIIFLMVSFIIVHEGVKIIEKSEVSMVILIFVIVALLAILAIPHINASNLTGFDISNFFIPYGVVFFAFLALPAMPEMNEELKNNKKDLKKAIIIGSLIPLFIYMLFALIVVGVTGINATDGAIFGLANILGNNVLLLGSVMGILTMSTSFIAVAFALTEMYHFDHNISNKNSSILACFIPLIISLVLINSNIKNAFFMVLDITGSIGGSLTGILIILIWLKAKKAGKRKPEYSINNMWIISLILILMFILGIIFEIKSLLS